MLGRRSGYCRMLDWSVMVHRNKAACHAALLYISTSPVLTATMFHRKAFKAFMSPQKHLMKVMAALMFIDTRISPEKEKLGET